MASLGTPHPTLLAGLNKAKNFPSTMTASPIAVLGGPHEWPLVKNVIKPHANQAEQFRLKRNQTSRFFCKLQSKGLFGDGEATQEI